MRSGRVRGLTEDEDDDENEHEDEDEDENEEEALSKTDLLWCFVLCFPLLLNLGDSDEPKKFHNFTVHSRSLMPARKMKRRRHRVSSFFSAGRLGGVLFALDFAGGTPVSRNALPPITGSPSLLSFWKATTRFGRGRLGG